MFSGTFYLLLMEDEVADAEVFEEAFPNSITFPTNVLHWTTWNRRNQGLSDGTPLECIHSGMHRTDLTPQQWDALQPLLPQNPQRGQAYASHRNVLNGIVWRTKTASFHLNSTVVFFARIV